MKRLKKELVEIFEDQILRGTCFKTLKELQADRTDPSVNFIKAVIAIELLGVWKGMNLMNDLEE